MSSLIYDYYEEGVLFPEKTPAGVDNYSYVCKLCKAVGRKKMVIFSRLKIKKVAMQFLK